MVRQYSKTNCIIGDSIKRRTSWVSPLKELDCLRTAKTASSCPLLKGKAIELSSSCGGSKARSSSRRLCAERLESVRAIARYRIKELIDNSPVRSTDVDIQTGRTSRVCKNESDRVILLGLKCRSKNNVPRTTGITCIGLIVRLLKVSASCISEPS